MRRALSPRYALCFLDQGAFRLMIRRAEESNRGDVLLEDPGVFFALGNQRAGNGPVPSLRDERKGPFAFERPPELLHL